MSSNLDTKKNPLEFAYAVTNKTLAFEACFSPASFENNEFPLELYDGFSRLKGALIDTDGTPTTFNIPKRDLAMLLKRSDFAINKGLEFDLTSLSQDKSNLSPAYTIKLRSGKFKDKTPAEVLLDDISNKEALNQQYQFIYKNMQDPKNAKYKKTNEDQLKAICDAADLLENGKLSSDNLTKKVSIPIYEPGFRPLKRKKRDDGKTFVYDIKIIANLGADFPICITVENFYAPLEEKNNGLLNVKASDKDMSTAKKNEISLSYDMWENICCNIKMQMRAFEIAAYPYARKIALEQEKKNRDTASIK